MVEVTSTVLGNAKKRGEKIKIRPFTTDTATVGAKYGITKQTIDGSYVKIDVFISCPCYKEEIVDVFGQVRDLADELMEAEVKRVLGGK